MSTYRVGNHQPQNVYRGEQYIGVMFTAEDAALAVEALSLPRLLTDLIDSLERCGCQFWACEGETLEPIDMVTCHRCALLAQLRQLPISEARR